MSAVAPYTAKPIEKMATRLSVFSFISAERFTIASTCPRVEILIASSNVPFNSITALAVILLIGYLQSSKEQ